jgi:hypothetical protein
MTILNMVVFIELHIVLHNWTLNLVSTRTIDKLEEIVAQILRIFMDNAFNGAMLLNN